MNQSVKHIQEFEPLRFSLCVLVFLQHAFHFGHIGSAAVAVLFMLSGFCLTLGYRERILAGQFSYRKYMLRRLIKFYPIHWITLITFILLSILVNHYIPSWKRILVDFMLLQSWIPNHHVYFSLNGVAWFISTLLPSVILLPYIIRFLERIDNPKKIYLFLTLSIIVYVIPKCLPTKICDDLLVANPIYRMTDFIIGVYTAYLFGYLQNNQSLNKCIKGHKYVIDIISIANFVGLVLASQIPNISRYTTMYLYWICGIFIILSLSISCEGGTPFRKLLCSNIIQRISRCSFSMMMWQLVILYFFWRIPTPCIFICVFCISQISYIVIEKKLVSFMLQKLIS